MNDAPDAGEAPAHAAATECPRGAFTVALNLESLARTDASAPEDDLRTWAQTALLHDGGGEAPAVDGGALWWAPGNSLSRTSVTNTSAAGAPYNYLRESQPLPLSAPAVGALARARLLVTVHRGAARDPAVDACVGWAELPLEELVAHGGGAPLKRRLELRDPAGVPAAAGARLGLQTPPPQTPSAVRAYTGRLAVTLTANAPLRDYLLGGRVVTLTGGRLHPLPPAWAARAPESALGSALHTLPPEQVAALCARRGAGSEDDADPALSWRYVLELAVPQLAPDGSATGVDAVDAQPLRLHVATGSLRYVQTSVAAAEGGAGAAAEGQSSGGATGVLAPAAGAPAAAAAPSTTTSRPPSAAGSSKPGAAASATAGKSAAAATTSAAPAKPAPVAAAAAAAEAKAREAEADAARLRALHAGYDFVVEWPPHTLFLPAPAVAALTPHLQPDGTPSGGGTLRCTLRRVGTHAIDASEDGLDAAVGLAPGRRLASEDFSARGEVTLPLAPLAAPGVSSVSCTQLHIAPVSVSEAEREAWAAAQLQRDAAWEAHLAHKAQAAAAAAAAAPGAPGGKGAKAKGAQPQQAAGASATGATGAAPAKAAGG